MKKLLIVAILLCPSLARATEQVVMLKEDWQTRISALAINSARWTGWIQVDTMRSVALEIAYTYSAATAVTMRCESSNNSSTANDSGFDLHILLDSATAGTSDSYTHTWSNAVSASESWVWVVANLPHDYVNCVFNGTGAGAGDTVTVKSRGVAP